MGNQSREISPFTKGFNVTCGVIAALFFTFVILPLLVCAGCPLIMFGSKKSNPPTIAREAIQRHTTTVPKMFDVPALMGKSIDQVRDALGNPNDRNTEPTDLQFSQGIRKWENLFTRNGIELLVTFDAGSRQVVDFFIPGEDRVALMQLANVRHGEESYIVEFVRAIGDPSRFTGMKVIPVRPHLSSDVAPAVNECSDYTNQQQYGCSAENTSYSCCVCGPDCSLHSFGSLRL